MNSGDLEGRGFPWSALIRASSLHVGAAAAAASLRRELVESGQITTDAFDEAFAVARVTPGTNLLAMYVLLGERFRGWAGALAALLVGTLVPATIALTLSAAYLALGHHPLTQLVMRGARAGALAVFAWAIVRLARPQLRARPWRSGAIVLITMVLLQLSIPQFVVLLSAGAIGAMALRGDS